MNQSIIPVVTQCRDGRWLAVTPEGEHISVGVISASEADARDRFDAAVARWHELLAGENCEQEKAVRAESGRKTKDG